MFHLFSSIYTDLTQRPRFNILCVGSSGSGKTTLLQILKARYIPGQRPPTSTIPLKTPPKTRPTVGQNVFDIQAPLPSARPLILPAFPPPQIEPPPPSASSSWLFSSPSSPSSSTSPASTPRQASKAVLHIWDLGGEKGLRSIWKEYYNEADCVVYFWDCGNASRGEAREEEWRVLASLAEEAELANVPFLVLLSRSDLSASGTGGGGHVNEEIDEISRQRRSTDADVDAADDSAKHSIEDDEDGDLSLSISESTEPIRGAEAAQAPQEALPSPPPSSSSPIPPPPPPPPPLTPVTPMEDSDVLESLRMFILSNIEATTAAAAKKATREEVKEDDEGGEDDAESNAIPPDYSSAPPFPETTILPVSSITGKGIIECMDWLVQKSLASTRRV